MTDLSAPEIQSTFKKLQRTTIATNVMMGVVTVIAAAIGIWASSLKPWKDKSWAEIFFFVLIGILAAYFVFVLVWEIRLRRISTATVHKFIAEGFQAQIGLLQGGSNAEIELSLAGDKLTVMRAGRGEYIQFDLSPVKSFTSVCSATERYAIKFVRDYCSLAAARGEIAEASLTNKIRPKPKKHVFVENGVAVKDVSKSYFVKNGMIV